MYLHAPVYDESALLEECKYHYQQAVERGILTVFPEIPEPVEVSEYISFFKRTCLPFQTFARVPETMYGFVPDVEELVDMVAEDEIFTVPSIEDLPEDALGFGLTIDDSKTTLFFAEGHGEVLVIWTCSNYWGKLILEKASEYED
jgi:hypothetical protein